MTEINMLLTAPPADLLAASTVMLDRAIWWRRRLLLLGLPMALAAGMGLGMAWLTDVPLQDAGLIVLYTFLGGAIGLIVAGRSQARAYARLFATSALRSEATPITLSDAGLRLQPRTVPWSAVRGTSRWKANTLVQFSPVDAVVIPDRDLPAGLTPDDLGARITAWRTA